MESPKLDENGMLGDNTLPKCYQEAKVSKKENPGVLGKCGCNWKFWEVIFPQNSKQPIHKQEQNDQDLEQGLVSESPSIQTNNSYSLTGTGMQIKTNTKNQNQGTGFHELVQQPQQQKGILIPTPQEANLENESKFANKMTASEQSEKERSEQNINQNESQTPNELNHETLITISSSKTSEDTKQTLKQQPTLLIFIAKNTSLGFEDLIRRSFKAYKQSFQEIRSSFTGSEITSFKQYDFKIAAIQQSGRFCDNLKQEIMELSTKLDDQLKILLFLPKGPSIVTESFSGFQYKSVCYTVEKHKYIDDQKTENKLLIRKDDHINVLTFIQKQ